jgi:basic endochitinase B
MKRILLAVAILLCCFRVSAEGAERSGEGLERLLSKTLFDEMFPNRNYYLKLKVYPAYKDTTVDLETGEVRHTPGVDLNYEIITYEALIEAAKKFPEFCNNGSEEDDKRELAAFLGNAAQETFVGWGSVADPDSEWYKYGLGITIEGGIIHPKFLQVTSAEYPPVGENSYQGRGALQLSYNPNYGMFGEDTRGDKNIFLKNPDIIGYDPKLFWETAIWFWMFREQPDTAENWMKPSCHEAMKYKPNPVQTEKYGTKPGYGLTAICINGGVEGRKNLDALEGELKGLKDALEKEKDPKEREELEKKIKNLGEKIQGLKNKVLSRRTFYKNFCKKLGVDPGPEDTLLVFEMDPFPQGKK